MGKALISGHNTATIFTDKVNKQDIRNISTAIQHPASFVECLMKKVNMNRGRGQRGDVKCFIFSCVILPLPAAIQCQVCLSLLHLKKDEHRVSGEIETQKT